MWLWIWTTTEMVFPTVKGEGCQDAAACNYNPDATDPDVCFYPVANFDCDGNSLRPMFTSFRMQTWTHATSQVWMRPWWKP